MRTEKAKTRSDLCRNTTDIYTSGCRANRKEKRKSYIIIEDFI